MEKRVLIAAFLSAIFLTLYSNLVMRSAWRRVPVQMAQIPSETSVKPLLTQVIENERVQTIESDELRVGIGEESGSIRWVGMKRFPDLSGKSPLRFGGSEPVLSIRIGEPVQRFHLVENSTDRVRLEATDQNNSYHLSYSINRGNSLIKLELHQFNKSSLSSSAPVIITGNWPKADKSNNRYNLLEIFVLQNSDGGKTSYQRYVGPIRSAKIVPRGTTLISLAEKYFSYSIRSGVGDLRATILQSLNGSIAVESRGVMERGQDGGFRYSATVYLGPRDYFYLRKAGFSDAFPVGVISQIGLIFLLVLKSIASVVKSYGFGIIIFASLITLTLSPLTMVSMRSMKKMQELKPKIDRVMAQHKDDQMKANQAVFALYKEHKISPLSGCLPMLLQMPIFIALFQAMSHFIEFRGKSFLWVKDLSLPDRIVQMPFSLPILGREVNVLPIIMAMAMFFQTKLSQQNSGVGETNPTAKMMSGPMMPIMFCFMFYGFPSGLVLYWLTNSLLSIMIYRIAK